MENRVELATGGGDGGDVGSSAEAGTVIPTGMDDVHTFLEKRIGGPGLEAITIW